MKKCKLEDCPRVEQTRRGFCRVHYRRFMEHGDPYRTLVAPKDLSLEGRLSFTGWKVVPRNLETPCWEWLGDSRKGYGCLTFEGRKWIATHASLLVWRGVSVPPGMQARHKCDNPICINPDHLEVGTVRQNAQDMLERGRHIPPRGSKNGMSRLSESQVLEIRELLNRGQESGVEIARKFNVSPATISSIKTGFRWGHLSREGEH